MSSSQIKFPAASRMANQKRFFVPDSDIFARARIPIGQMLYSPCQIQRSEISSTNISSQTIAILHYITDIDDAVS